jgi:hypothetical protein
MKKETLKQIVNLANSIFEDDKTRNVFLKNIQNNKLQNARLMTNSLIDRMELLKVITENNVLSSQLKMANQLEDLLMDLIINEKAHGKIPIRGVIR